MIVNLTKRSGEILRFESPSTRYQGSKKKLLPWMWEHLGHYKFNSVLDVFGGTGSVSYLFKRMGKRVTYNDYLRWNYFIGTAMIENDKIQLTDQDIAFLTQPVSGIKPGFVSRTFKGMYFTRCENLWIDCVVSRIGQLSGNEEELKYKAALAYYSLFQTCLVKRPFNLFHRANLSVRMADVSRTFGNKTTWEKPFKKHFVFFANEINSYVCKGKRPCYATNCSADDIQQSNYDLIYLDPPYIQRGARNETADYLHCYHFLEGLANYHDWAQSIDYAKRLLPITLPQNTRWTDAEMNTAAFESIFDKFNKSIIVVSYKKYGCPSIDTLVRMLKRRGKTVKLHTKHYKYALNGQNGSAKLNRECLIIAD